MNLARNKHFVTQSISQMLQPTTPKETINKPSLSHSSVDIFSISLQSFLRCSQCNPYLPFIAFSVLSCFGGKLRFSRWDREMERKHLNWYVCLYFLSEDVRSDMSWEEDREEEAEGGEKVDDVRKKRKHWKAKVEKSERKIQARYKQRDAEWQAGSSERQPKTKEVISKRVLSGLTCGLWIVLARLFFKYSFKQNVYISRH